MDKGVPMEINLIGFDITLGQKKPENTVVQRNL